ncbi:tetratricopeptide repeat protein [Saccharolobus islandicus]|uniref:TPR repeat-containing protein n=1 Tax=Saccharolobus islandicus (strain M.16.4 / Kamchatka \|nr:tetratricopeptide repeat protein [Sulfolobus islandicus]ACR41192.1 TPR repeat-containing protein [Sulfolobus islandicus M.16.4]
MSLQRDLFGNYNSWFIKNKIIPITSNVKKEDNIECLNLGPPQSGKSWIAGLIQQHCTPVKESIIGLINLEPVEPKKEHRITAVQQPLIQGNKLLDTIVNFFSQHIFPWINTLRETEAIDFNKLTNFSEHELDLLKEYFSEVKRVPRGLTKHLIELREKYGPIIIYYIPWDVNKYVESGEIGLDEQVIEAVRLIKKYFNKEKKHLPIKWLGKDYIPPGLVYEIINKASEVGCAKVEGCKVAEEFVKEQADAYYEVVKFLVGEKDSEFEGILGLSITKLKNSIHDILSNVISTVIIGVMSLTVSIVILTLISASMYMLSERSEHGIADEIIKLKTNWGKLSEPLKKIIEWKVSIQLGVTPGDVERAINHMTGLDEQKIRESVKELEKKLEELESRVYLVESQLKGFKIYKLSDIEKGYLYSNVRLVNDSLGIVSETYGKTEVNIVKVNKFNEYLTLLARELEKGFTVINGPKGIGKSTLAVYTIWNLLRDGYYGVIRVEDIIDDNKRLKLENFLRDYSDDLYSDNLKAYLGKLIILYDPSSTESFTSPIVSINVKSVEETVKQLVKLSNELDKYGTSLLIVIPDDLYNGLSEEVRKSLKNVINIDLKDAEFLKAVIKEYSGCNLGDKLNELSNEVMQFSEGYTLIARLIGEGLRKSNCSLIEIEKILRDAQGNAKAFIMNFINNYLRIVYNGTPNVQRIKTFSEILSVMEPFKLISKVGDYIATPYFIGRLAYWSSELGLSDEERNWLAIKHEDLIEAAITEIVKAVNGGQTASELNEALRYWREYGELKIFGNVDDLENRTWDTIDYLFGKYGERLKKAFENVDDKCWKGLILTLGTAWSQSLGVLESAKKLNDLAEDVREAVEYLDGDYCDALNLLIANWKLAWISDYLLIRLKVESLEAGGSGEKKLVNPILHSLAEGKSSQVKESLKRLSETAIGRKGIWSVESFYGLGLSILSAYANMEGIGGYDDEKLAINALKLAGWSIEAISNPPLVHLVTTLCGYLGIHNLNYWSLVLFRATDVLSNNEELKKLKPFVDDLWKIRDGLEDWSRALLVHTMANTLSVSGDVCNTFRNIVDLMNEIGSIPLTKIAFADVYQGYVDLGLNCKNVPHSVNLCGCKVSLLDPLQGLNNLIGCFGNTDSWLNDDQLVEYLRGRSFEDDKDALNWVINGTLGSIYFSLGKINLYEGDFDKAEDYYKKAKEIDEKLENWVNYIALYNLIARVRGIKAKDFNKLLEVTKEFEDVFKEAYEKLGVGTAGLTLRTDILSEYLVYLGLSGNKEGAKKVLEEHGWLLVFLPSNVRTLTRLLLYRLGIVNDKPSVGKILDSITFRPWSVFLKPAFKISLGMEVDCFEECSSLEGCDEDCLTDCDDFCSLLKSAIKGDKGDLKKFVNRLRAVIGDEIVNKLATGEYSVEAVVQAITPSESMDSLVLILYNLVNNDYVKAEAIAEIGELAYDEPVLKKLFGELKDAIEKRDEEGIKFVLAKLYYFHV